MSGRYDHIRGLSNPANDDKHTHRNDSLYPRSVYYCPSCGTLHGTRACNGAVNWQYPNELIGGLPDSHKPAKQEYVGYMCQCGQIVAVRQ